jgi:NDP-sugar pyrophosphorylase family protein
MDLSPARFFDLSSFAHAELFDGLEHVWGALDRLERWLARHLVPAIEGEVHPGAHLLGDAIRIGPGTVVEPGATIRGPALIGANCTIRANAFMRDGNLIGDGCVVGTASELKNTILLDGAHAPHFNYCGDSILGRGTNLGAGTKLSNVLLRKGEIVLRIDGLRIPTGRRKFGAVLGDGAQTGCNSVLNPGTLLGRGALVFPCVNAGGFVPEGATVRPPERPRIELPKG